jgi:hypothetical protein
VSATQGVNILLNIFYGVTLNAAMGIANQVNSAVNQFVSNFQTAFVPQITKLYAKGDILHIDSDIFTDGSNVKTGGTCDACYRTGKKLQYRYEHCAVDEYSVFIHFPQIRLSTYSGTGY